MKPNTVKEVAREEAARAPQVRHPEYRSEELLGETRQAAIVHRGQRYILRETRSGKLILYK